MVAERTIRKPWFRYGEGRLRIAFQGEKVKLDGADLERGEQTGAFVEQSEPEQASGVEETGDAASAPRARRARTKRS